MSAELIEHLQIENDELREKGIHDMNALLLFATECYKLFRENWMFRGHARSDWNLVPAIFRSERDPQDESVMIEWFKEQALSRMDRPPLHNSHDEWMILMRHYGLPTRLLDWTMSPLISLYFTICNQIHDNCDGIIWAIAISPISNLNDTPIRTGIAKLLGDANSGVRSQSVYAMYGKQIDQRIKAQQGKFTIHGDGTPLESFERSYSCLRYVRIPKNCKVSLRKSLEFFGIRRHELFPDLESLAKYCATLHVVP